MTRYLAPCLLGGSAALCCAVVLWHAAGSRVAPGDQATSGPDILPSQDVPANETYHLIQRKRAIIGDLFDGRLSLDEASDRFEALNRERWPDKGDRFLRARFSLGRTYPERVRLQVLAYAEAEWRTQRDGPMPAWLEQEIVPP